MVLFLFIFMAVLSSALLAVDSNTRNMLRNEAVNIAAQAMSDAKNYAFANITRKTTDTPRGPDTAGVNCPLSTGAVPNAIAIRAPINFRNFKENFCVANSVVPISTDKNDVMVTVTVTWPWKGQAYTHTIQTAIENSVQ